MKDELDNLTADLLPIGFIASHYQAVTPIPDHVVSGRRWNGSTTPDKIKNDWMTPLYIVRYLELKQGSKFQLDPAADAKSAKAEKYFTKFDDGLKQDWTDYQFIFLNPPYGDILPWIEKAIQTVKAGKNITIHMVLPSDISTKWFRRAVIACSEVIHLISDGKRSGRVAFLNPVTGEEVGENNKGTQIFTFTSKSKPTRTLYISRSDMEKSIESGE
uniref:DNA methyltransferase n=2 Tax=unclassified Caudoviricetes TaxID=2788787 RepID=A0AB39AC36_9CAUD